MFLVRGQDCDLIIKGDLISRHHSKLEHRRGKFIIADQSTNGTFIQTTEGQEIFLRREEFTVFGSGYISLGKKVDPSDENIIHLSLRITRYNLRTSMLEQNHDGTWKR